MTTIKSAELEGNTIHVTFTDGKASDTLSWGQNRNEKVDAFKARVKIAAKEVLAVRNPKPVTKTPIQVSELL